MQSDAFHREKIASLGFCRQASFLAVLDVHQVLTIFNVRSIDGKLIACSQLQQVTRSVYFVGCKRYLSDCNNIFSLVSQ